jgi:hypothetical protein
MDKGLRQALARDRVIDITTTGRKSGQPRRIEIWFHRLDGRLFITGLPGHRSWYANLLANPAFTFHLKGSAKADLPGLLPFLKKISGGRSCRGSRKTWEGRVIWRRG